MAKGSYSLRNNNPSPKQKYTSPVTGVSDLDELYGYVSNVFTKELNYNGTKKSDNELNEAAKQIDDIFANYQKEAPPPLQNVEGHTAHGYGTRSTLAISAKLQVAMRHRKLSTIKSLSLCAKMRPSTSLHIELWAPMKQPHS